MLARGARLTELLKQPQYAPYTVEEQVVVIFAGVNGYTDKIPVEQVTNFEKQYISEIRAKHDDLLATIRTEQAISDDTDKKLRGILEDFVKTFA